MKNLILIVLFIPIFTLKSQTLNDDTNKYIHSYLSDSLEINNDEYLLIIYDGKPFPKALIESTQYSDLKKSEITNISFMEANDAIGKKLWGDIAENGILFIETNLVKYAEPLDASKSIIKYFLDKKEITKEEVDLINFQEDIEMVNVYKNYNKFTASNGEEFHGIIDIISFKK